ncbi:MAG: alpha/beta hydrolase [Candidatus Nanopelagicales bacterium]|nr:alpha/beta hydrolase [Candidatus Nanopelagicales bacterium]MCF8537744.1 alpha/beta hydrolase [Candidatus Nanopelagicales bacterium]MCF8542540.1 alpha/beta hydrolase [Candidatus Nanopelagicales bacterium]
MRPAVIGVGVGAAVGAAVALASRGPTLVEWPTPVRRAFPFVLGGLTGGVVGMKTGASLSLLRAATGRGPGPITSATPVIIGAAALGAVAVAGRLASARVLGGLAEQGRELDDVNAQPPANPDVSGGPGSLVSVEELGREGARFVNDATTPDGIREVTLQEPVASPVRVFIGVDAASTPEQRVGLAMAELRRTGAFDRGTLLIQAPAGSGYANSFPVDVLEVLTRGDCASVAVGYGVMPSFLSLNKVPVARQTQRLLLDAIRAEVQDRPTKPRLLLYGESLGAEVQESAVPAGPADLDHYGIAAALWVGTPGGDRSDLFHALCADESFTVDRPEQLPDPMPSPRPRVWFLEHDGDPVVRFRPKLLLDRPAWLSTDGQRGRNIPDAMTWKPGITFAEAFVDTMFATHVKPGLFESRGHDYRADLGAVTTTAFDLPSDPDTSERLEAYLRRTEVERAQRLGEA